MIKQGEETKYKTIRKSTVYLFVKMYPIILHSCPVQISPSSSRRHLREKQQSEVLFLPLEEGEPLTASLEHLVRPQPLEVPHRGRPLGCSRALLPLAQGGEEGAVGRRRGVGPLGAEGRREQRVEAAAVLVAHQFIPKQALRLGKGKGGQLSVSVLVAFVDECAGCDRVGVIDLARQSCIRTQENRWEALRGSIAASKKALRALAKQERLLQPAQPPSTPP